MKTRLSLIFVLIIFNIGCEDSDNLKESVISLNNNSIISTYNGGTITLGEIEKYLISLPSGYRWNTKTPQLWLKSIIKELILEKILIREANSSGISLEKLFTINAHFIDNLAYSNHYLEQNPDTKIINANTIQNYYNEHPELYSYPQQRTVHHIYKNINTNKKQTLFEITEIRNKILKGENFFELARSQSESETRHKDGFLKIFKDNDKPKIITDIVFNLDRYMPSQPILLSNGYHIFYVSEVLKEIKIPLSEVKSSIANDIRTQYYQEHIKKIATKLVDDKTFYVVSKDKFKNIIKNSLHDEALIKIDNFILTYNNLANDIFVQMNYTNLGSSDGISHDLILDLAYREMIFQHMKKSSGNSEILNKDSVQNLKHQLLLTLYKDKKIRDYLDSNPHIIHTYYENNKKRFYTPMLLEFQILSIPIDTKNLMPTLEQSSLKLNNQSLSLDIFLQNYNAIVENIGLKSVEQLSIKDSKILNFGLDLKIGEYSPPFISNNNYTIIKLVNRVESKSQEFNTVKSKVTNEFLKLDNSEIIFKISKKMLSDITFNDREINYFIEHPLLLDE